VSETPSSKKDFEQFRKSGLPAGATWSIGMGFVNARNRVAGVLVRAGVRPNHLTIAGFLFSIVVGACFVMGAGHHALYERVIPGVGRSGWPLVAALFLVLAGACDMLDGAVARLGQVGTRFGGVLDSTLDRFSDIAIYLGICIHFTYKANVTYAVLAVLAMCNGYMISYVKARAEDYVDDCSVGYWLRGERTAGLLQAALVSHVPAWLWLQGISPLFTVAARLRHARSEIRRLDAGEPPREVPAPRGLLAAIRSGRYPRGSTAYDVITACAAGFFVIAPWVHPFFYGGSDPLRRLLQYLL
jgi:CDP-diacylglycerol--glycerol-3-phosphate 3-phosphatidyltransferase